MKKYKLYLIINFLKGESMGSYNFQKELEKSILKADEKLDKKELLIDVFKSYVAKLFEMTINKSGTKNRIEYSALVQTKRNIINEFRQASLSELQMSVKQYEDLFDKTVQEIVDFAGSMHEGVDETSVDKTLSIDKGGFWDSHKTTDSGVIIRK